MTVRQSGYGILVMGYSGRRDAYRYDWRLKKTWQNPRVKTIRKSYVPHWCVICSKVIRARTSYLCYPPGVEARCAHIECVDALPDEGEESK